jgi:hypothetical protein
MQQVLLIFEVENTCYMLLEWLEGAHKGHGRAKAPWESTVIPNFAALTVKRKQQGNRRVPETVTADKLDCLPLGGLEAVRFLVPNMHHTEPPQYWIPIPDSETPWDEKYTATEDSCSDMVMYNS